MSCHVVEFAMIGKSRSFDEILRESEVAPDEIALCSFSIVLL